MRPLTPRQQQVLDQVRYAIEAYGYSPSLREIGAALGISSSSTIAYHIWALERKGYITQDSRKARTIRLVERSD